MKRRQTKLVSFKQYVKMRKSKHVDETLRDRVINAIKKCRYFPTYDIIPWPTVRMYLLEMKKEGIMADEMIADAYRLWLGYCAYMKRMRFSVEPASFGERIVANPKASLPTRL